MTRPEKSLQSPGAGADITGTMGRSILSVIAGYFTMLIAVTGALGFLFLVAFDEFPTDPAAAYTGGAWVLWAELGVSGLAAAAGGYVCAWVARRRPLAHAGALTGLVAVLGIVSALTDAGLKPLWSSIGIVLIAIPAIMAGAWLRARAG